MWGGGLRERDMLARARARWSQLSREDRVVLDYAYRDALRNPHRVANFSLKIVNLTPDVVVLVHSFRFGYANFRLVQFEEEYYIYDLWLDEAIYIAAE